MEAPQQLIRQWFDSQQDYTQGVQLAKAYGTGGWLLALLESSQNSFTEQKLREALQELLDQFRSQANVPAPVAADAAPATEPPELLAVRARRIASYKEANHHFGQMRATPPGPARGVHALAVKKLMRENAALFNKEQYYAQFGFLPPEQELATLDTSDLRAVERRRNNLRTYLSSAKNGTRARVETEKQVAAWTAERMELDLILQHGQPV